MRLLDVLIAIFLVVLLGKASSLFSVAIITPARHPGHIHLLLPGVKRATRFWELRWFIVYSLHAEVGCTYSSTWVLQLVYQGTATEKINYVLKTGLIASEQYVLLLDDTELLLPTLPLVPLTQEAYVFIKEDPANGRRMVSFIAKKKLLSPTFVRVDLNVDAVFLRQLRRGEEKNQTVSHLPEIPGSHVYFGLLQHYCGPRLYPPICVALDTAANNNTSRPTVHILTNCARPKFLNVLLPFVEDANEFWNVTWWITYNDDDKRVQNRPDFQLLTSSIHVRHLTAREKPLGNISEKFFPQYANLNQALSYITDPDTYIWALDDDTVIHPSLPRFPLSAGRSLIFGQWMGEPEKCHLSEVVRAKLRNPKTNMKVHNVDQGQFLLTRKVIGDLRYREDRYEADGIFLNELYERHSDQVVVMDTPMSYYNALSDFCLMKLCTGKLFCLEDFHDECPAGRYLNPAALCGSGRFGRCNRAICCTASMPLPRRSNPAAALTTFHHRSMQWRRTFEWKQHTVGKRMG